MVEVSYVCPLKLPKGRTLSPKRLRRFDSGFPPTMTIDEAVRYLEDECRDLGDVSVKLYSYYDRLNHAKARRKLEDDSAICCEMLLNSKEYYLVFDKWGAIEQNLYALHLALRAIKNLVKWGLADLETIMSPFSAIQIRHVYNAPSTSDSPSSYSNDVMLPDWMILLEIDPNSTLEEANHNYRRLAKSTANDEQKLLLLNQAIDIARKHFGH